MERFVSEKKVNILAHLSSSHEDFVQITFKLSPGRPSELEVELGSAHFLTHGNLLESK